MEFLFEIDFCNLEKSTTVLFHITKTMRGNRWMFLVSSAHFGCALFGLSTGISATEKIGKESHKADLHPHKLVRVCDG